MSVPLETVLFAILAATFLGLQLTVLKKGLEHSGSSVLVAVMMVSVGFVVFSSLTVVLHGLQTVLDSSLSGFWCF